jgi:hypothetical protein
MQQSKTKHLSLFSPEFQLLCSVLSCIIHKKELIWDTRVDYSKLKKLISKNNLSAMLYAHKNEFLVLKPIEEFLQSASKKSLIKHLQLKADFLKLWDILNQNQLKVTVYKGHYLIDAIYNQSNLRTSTDIDILIEPKDLWIVKDLLLSLGYNLVIPEYNLPENKATIFKKIENEIAFYTPNGSLVDLHFKLFKNPHYLKTKRWHTVDTVYEGRKMEVLPLPKIFVYLIVHGKKHDWNRLKWLLDIVQFYNIFKEEDWNLVDEIIKENDLEYMFYETLQLCEVLLGAKIPIRYQQNVLTVLADNFNPHKVLFPAKNKFFKNLQVLWEKKSWKYFCHQVLQFPARDLYWINIPVFPRLLHPIARPFVYLCIIRKSSKK